MYYSNSSEKFWKMWMIESKMLLLWKIFLQKNSDLSHASWMSEFLTSFIFLLIILFRIMWSSCARNSNMFSLSRFLPVSLFLSPLVIGSVSYIEFASGAFHESVSQFHAWIPNYLALSLFTFFLVLSFILELSTWEERGQGIEWNWWL